MFSFTRSLIVFGFILLHTHLGNFHPLGTILLFLLLFRFFSQVSLSSHNGLSSELNLISIKIINQFINIIFASVFVISYNLFYHLDFIWTSKLLGLYIFLHIFLIYLNLFNFHFDLFKISIVFLFCFALFSCNLLYLLHAFLTATSQFPIHSVIFRVSIVSSFILEI